MNSNAGLIIVFVLVGIAVIVMIPLSIKKKRDQKNKALISSRHNKDEVWKSIKQYLKDSGQYGNKIISSYVAKRNDINYINPNDSNYSKRKQKIVNKIRDYQYSEEKKHVKITNKKAKFVRPPVRDLYVVCFQTQNTKTGRKTQDRQIFINGSCDYNKEMEWIAPIRDAEIERSKKIEEKELKKQEKLRAKLAKKQAKEKSKIEKTK